MPNAYLHHVTLASGHVRRSPRSEVGDDVIAMLRPILEAALRGGPQPVPGQPGYTVTGGVHGRCCALTLWRTLPEATDEGGPDRVPILTTGVGAHSRCGSYLWRHLHESARGVPLATDPAQVPPEPWCADRIEVGLAAYPEAAEWTGDWSRCAAWAWIEMRTEARIS